MTILLEVKNITTMLRTGSGKANDPKLITAVDNVSLKLKKGRSLALVGESGSGKSLTCISLLGLLPVNGKLVSGEVLFKGRDLATMSQKELEKVRGNEIGMILQDAMTSLNPLLTIGQQVGEVFKYHKGINNSVELRRRCVEVLEKVKIPAAESRLESYPFQFSGGMRQRVSIAINVALSPDLLICDEPTTALDATVQLQILKLLRELQQDHNMSIIFVTHDLHLAAQFCDDVAIMYAGKIVESGPIKEVFDNPVHPYTEGLLQAVPSLDDYSRRIEAIPGQQPSLKNLPKGCRYAPRCPVTINQCEVQYPDWFEWEQGRRRVACWLVQERLSEAHDAVDRPASVRMGVGL